MAWDRKERIEAQLREKIAIVVLDRLNDPRLGFLTITGVKLSGDKRYAKVFFTVLGTANQRRTTERALKDAARHVQELVAPSMRLRVMPELRFTYDESIAVESRMLGILGELASARGDKPAGPDGAGADVSLADAEARKEPGDGDASDDEDATRPSA